MNIIMYKHIVENHRKIAEGKVTKEDEENAVAMFVTILVGLVAMFGIAAFVHFAPSSVIEAIKHFLGM